MGKINELVVYSPDGPRLQNIPIRTETGNRVRTALRAHTTMPWPADYSQVELRLWEALRGSERASE